MKPNTPWAPRHERRWPELSAAIFAFHAVARSSSVSDAPTGPPRTPPSAAPVGMGGEATLAGADATLDAAAPGGVSAPATGGGPFEPTL